MTLNRTAIDRYWTPERRKNFTGGKKLLLLPWEAPELLTVMDLMNPEGSLTRTQTKKLLQVNHMLQLLRPQLASLAKQHERIRICEAACGNSYLSLLLAWYFQHIEPHPVLVLGLDANPKVIASSRERAKQVGLDAVARFAEQSLLVFDWRAALQEQFPEFSDEDDGRIRPHLFAALHACDSLSCHALSQALRWHADVIAVAPCCQAELARLWKDADEQFRSHPLEPIRQSPQLRRSLAADYTDAYRLLLVKAFGYNAEAIEFVPSEHTPKNRLILAQRHQRYNQTSFRQYQALLSATGGISISLENLLKSQLPVELANMTSTEPSA